MNNLIGAIFLEALVKGGGEYTNIGTPTGFSSTSSNLTFEYSFDKKIWNVDGIFASGSTFANVAVQKVRYYFFHDKPYFFRINQSSSGIQNHDVYGLTDIILNRLTEHGINSNPLRTSADLTSSKDNFNISRPIPRTDLGYSWRTRFI